MVAVFGGLTQVELGPEVVASVLRWLDGWDAIAAPDSKVPGALALVQNLRKKQLTDAAIAEARALVAEIEAGGSFAKTTGPTAEETWKARREALAALRLAYQDWAVTFRAELRHHDLLRLGLREVSAAKPEEPKPS